MNETKLTPILDRSTEVNFAAEIIFVHGLGGDGITTWSSKDTSGYHFPDLLQKDLECARIWYLDYPAHKTKWTEKGSSMGLYYRAKNVIDVLISENIGNIPLIFICHSLGGLLVKKIIRLSSGSSNPEIKRISDSTTGIAFIATPHRGSNLAKIAAYIDKIFLNLPRRSELVEELKAKSPELMELDEFYREKSVNLGIKTAAYRENKKLKGAFFVVDETSSDPFVAGCNTVPIDTDHEMICKPVKGKNSQIYKSIKRFADTVLKLNNKSMHPTGSELTKYSKGSPSHKGYEKYLHQLINYNKRLHFIGFPDLKVKKEVTLLNVFVMQRIVEGVPFKDYERLMKERGDDEAFTSDETQLRKIMVVRTGRIEEKKEPVKFNEIFEGNENQRFVLLGKPGSGKSTLLKFLMLEAAKKQLKNHRDSENLLFPILVEIRKFKNVLSKAPKPGYNILDYLYDSIRRDYSITLPPGFFEKHLDSGRALLMFDGLDEVVSETQRTDIRQMIETFITSHNNRNKVIVTSRIDGYSSVQFSTTDYRHFTLEDFNDDEIEVFIEKWYRTRITNISEANTKAIDLKKALEKKPVIKELAKNPLLLTIIAGIHRGDAPLPKDRLLLYDKATEILLYTWDNVRDIIDEKFKPEEKRHFLEKVAFQLQTLEKGEEAGIAFERNDLYDILLTDFCKIFKKETWQAKALIDKFLDTMCSRTGLLVKQAPDQYSFVHKTFQEYFAAKWMAENNDSVNFQIMIDKFIDNPSWQETLLLALRALPKRQALTVLEHVLNRDAKKIENYFYLNHYFVMKFIAEQGKWLDNKNFIEKQIDDFFDFSWNEGEDRSYHTMKTMDRFKNWVSTVTDSLVRSNLSNKLLSLAEDTKQDNVLRRYCAEIIGNLGRKDKAVDILLSIARDEKQGGWLRYYCAYAVGNLGIKDKAVDILLSITEDEKQDRRLRRECAYTVGKLGDKDKAVDILLSIAWDEKQDGWLRRECAYNVGNLGVKDKAMEILLSITEDEKQPGWLRRECAYNAGNLGGKDKATVDRLLAIAVDEKQHGYLRCNCAYAVGNFGLKNKAVDILLTITRDEKKDVPVRRACAEAVGNLGVKDKVVNILFPIAQDEKQDGYLRRACAEALGNLGFKNKAVNILLPIAQDKKQSSYLRRACAESVGHLGMKENAVDILFDIAQDINHDDWLRRYCGETIGKLGFKEKAVDILVDIYLAQQNKYTEKARKIYNVLWAFTEI